MGRNMYHTYKRKLALILATLFIICEIQSITVNAAITQPEITQIDDMVKEQMTKSKIPDLTIAVMKDNAVNYLSYSKGKTSETISENSLFQIGSVSKAFTGLGILLLEDEGLVELQAPVSNYIPWFTVKYDGKEVNPKDLTIANLLHQTSGFLNDESKYPRALENMSLEENIRQTSGCELAFYPSSQYSYANTNYYLLGYIIEMVSGQSYQDFMHERIFTPLELNHTYASPELISETGNLVQGKRLSFLNSHPYEVPIVQGNVPAGYIITSGADLSRWLQIQMGNIKISDQFSRIIDKSHVPNPVNPVNNHAQYASGWFVDEQENSIYHSGGTPNFSSNISFYPDKNIGVCVLTNMNASANTNAIAKNVLNILEGKQPTPYHNDIWTTFDSIFSLLTLISSIGLLALVVTLIRFVTQIRSGVRKKQPIRKPLFKLLLPALFLAFTICNFVLLPMIFAADWSALIIWGPPSILTGSILLFASSVLLFGTVLLTALFRPNNCA